MKRTPAIVVLSVSSWVIAIIGLVIGGFYYFTSLEIGLGIVFGSIILAAVVRMLGNIGQMLFELSAYSLSFLKGIDRGTQDNFQHLQSLNQSLKDNSWEINQSLKDSFPVLLQSFKDTTQTLQQHIQEINQSLKDNSREIKQALQESFRDSGQTLQQINCDSRDMNKDIHDIRNFFEEIEKHLDLKK